MSRIYTAAFNEMFDGLIMFANKDHLDEQTKKMVYRNLLRDCQIFNMSVHIKHVQALLNKMQSVKRKVDQNTTCLGELDSTNQFFDVIESKLSPRTAESSIEKLINFAICRGEFERVSTILSLTKTTVTRGHLQSMISVCQNNGWADPLLKKLKENFNFEVSSGQMEKVAVHWTRVGHQPTADYVNEIASQLSSHSNMAQYPA